jgi:two-component sensor histidine kinase
VASIAPGSLAFGNQTINTTSATQTVTLTNTGNAALSIAGITVIGTNAGDFAQTNACGSSVAAGANCTITVTFTSAATGARAGTLTVTDNNNGTAGSTQTVSLSGTGTSVPAPVVSLSVLSLAFGNQTVNTDSTAQTVTLTNTGNAALSIAGITVTGTNASDFAQTNTCGSSVAAAANCTITVTFKPSASGSRTASVSITDNASGSPQTASLSGTGTAGVVSLSATSLAFGTQPVGTPGTGQTLTLSNTGSTALSITSLALTGTNASDFAQTNTCGSSVAAGSNCTISVTFKPSASGSRTASVSITDNASGSPQTVSLSGTGTAALVSLSPTSLAFGNQPVEMTSTAQAVTLSNTGNAALSITSLALTGTNASDFEQSNACGSSLAAGANCTIAVMFRPSVAGAEAASLSIADNSSGSPQTVALSGAGTHDVILTWAASTTPGVVGYDVYRGTTSGGPYPTQLNSTPINGTTYTDATVQAGQTYYYVVTAVASNDVTQSADSNQVSATVP